MAIPRARDPRFATTRPELSAKAVRALELHEAMAHAHGERSVRDLGDAILLHDPADRDTFVNRLSGLRLPAEDAAFQRRLTELLTLFASLDRQPHVWLSPGFHAPADLLARLAAEGFLDTGGLHRLLLRDADLPPAPLPARARIERLADSGPRRSVVVDGAALVMAESFGAGPGGSGPIAQDLGRTSGDEWDLCVVSVGDEPVATGRRYSSGGMTYLSSIATRPSWWGRGFGAAVTSALVADGRAAGTDMIYLGVETQNARAQRLYQRLGFERIGERVVDLVLA